MTPPVPPADAARLAALRRYHILDTEPEPAFDDLAALATHLCGTPVGAVSFVDGARQWFKARVGLAVRETPRKTAFCALAIQGPELLVVRDVLRDERFAGSPLATGSPPVRFYAGAPLTAPGGERLGTVCVMDWVPRELGRQRREGLRLLARQAVALLEHRRQGGEGGGA